MNFFYNGLLPELIAGILFYLAGLFSSRLWVTLNRNKIEKKLKDNIHIALNLIYEAEEKFVGRKLGARRLDYVVKRYMEITGEKNYEKVQEHVIKVFNLTTLSK